MSYVAKGYVTAIYTCRWKNWFGAMYTYSPLLWYSPEDRPGCQLRPASLGRSHAAEVR